MTCGASELAHHLARHAEAVCRHYLSNGRRRGRYWLVGDARNTPGRSLFVRLGGSESGPGAIGKWTDAATGEHGDLLDIIRERCGLHAFKDIADEARAFLRLPHPAHTLSRSQPAAAPTGSPQAARRLFGMSRPLIGTLAEAYLRGRGIALLHDTSALRFHPRCYYRPEDDGPTETWPAMIAAVTDLAGRITGVQRTWLDPAGFDPSRLGKAPLDTPRRAMGQLHGNAVRFGVARDVMAAGEGIETMLALRCALPLMPMAAALASVHLSALRLPGPLRRLYIAGDNDAAGKRAQTVLADRARQAGIEAISLSPRLGDFDEDLRRFGLDRLRAHVRVQLAPEDGVRFVDNAVAGTKEGPPVRARRQRSPRDVDGPVRAPAC